MRGRTRTKKTTTTTIATITPTARAAAAAQFKGGCLPKVREGKEASAISSGGVGSSAKYVCAELYIRLCTIEYDFKVLISLCRIHIRISR